MADGSSNVKIRPNLPPTTVIIYRRC